MKMKNHNGDEVEAFLEIVEERIGGVVTMSDIREPTYQEAEILMKTECDHDNQEMSLVYIDLGFPYNFRNCAVCGKNLRNRI